MRLFLLLLLAALLSGPRVFAQAPPAAPLLPDTLRPTTALAAPDTVAALHRLFAAKRRRNNYVMGATMLVTVGTLVALVSSRPDQPASNNGFGVIAPNDLDLVADAMVTLPVIPLVALAVGGWSPKQEHRAVAAWQQHQLPRWARRKLKPRYFRP